MKTVKPVTDPISDLLTRIRNALAAGQSSITLPHSNIKEVLAKLLKQYGFVEEVKVVKEKFKLLEVTLTNEGQNSRIKNIERISTPGRHLYVSYNQIPYTKGPKGLVVVSTSHGMMSGNEARKKRIGGELICQVW
jgi:small subunit ribosomal protein S8